MLRRAKVARAQRPVDELFAVMAAQPRTLDECLAALSPADGRTLSYAVVVERLVYVANALRLTPHESRAQLGQVAYALIVCALCLHGGRADELPAVHDGGALVHALALLWGAVAEFTAVLLDARCLAPYDAVSLLDAVFWETHAGNKFYMDCPPDLEYMEPAWPRALRALSAARDLVLEAPSADEDAADPRPTEQLVVARLLGAGGAELERVVLLRPSAGLLRCLFLQLRLGAVLARQGTTPADEVQWLRLTSSVFIFCSTTAMQRLYDAAVGAWCALNPSPLPEGLCWGEEGRPVASPAASPLGEEEGECDDA